MDENEIHQWLIDCFGQIQGEVAWNQFSRLPDEVREQLMSQDRSRLPKPDEVKSLMQAFTSGGLNSVGDMERTVNNGPINVQLATSIALQQAQSGDSEQTVGAQEAQSVRFAMTEANLWLDTVSDFNPTEGEATVLTRASWVEGTLGAWAKFAAPVAQSMNEALASVISQRLGGQFDGEIAGMFAGPVPIPIPEGMKDPAQLMRLLGNTSFAMQLGHAAGDLSREVKGSFDQGIALLDNPSGGLIAQNAIAYAKALDFERDEVLKFLALSEVAHARLFAAVPWLMPRFEALIGKYARGINIDLDAMEEQLRDAGGMDPESISGAMNLTKVGIADTPEQREALHSLETLLALVEGWVDCVTWKAGMAHIPHIEQLREMVRRERAAGGPAERTFESMIGLLIRPKRMREACALWEDLEQQEGASGRDAHWSHPDLLPSLPEDEHHDAGPGASSAEATTEKHGSTIDWDAELNELLDSEHSETRGNDTDGDTASDNNGSDGDATDDKDVDHPDSDDHDGEDHPSH